MIFFSVLMGCLLLVVIGFLLKPLETLKWLQRSILTLAGYRQKSFESDKGKIAYYEGGKGKKVVLIHGFMVHAGNWSDVAPKLKKRYHVFIPDLPGHGESPWIKPIKLESIGHAMEGFLLKISENEPITLIGSSMGGGVAFRFALDWPERVKHLIVINSAGIEWEIDRRMMLPQNKEEVLYKLRSILNPDLKVPSFFLQAMLYQNRPEIEALFDEAVGNPKYYLDEELQNLKPKAHLLWGERDGLFPMAYAQKMMTLLPDYVLTTFPKDAHVPHNTNAKKVLHYIYNVVR